MSICDVFEELLVSGTVCGTVQATKMQLKCCVIHSASQTQHPQETMVGPGCKCHPQPWLVSTSEGSHPSQGAGGRRDFPSPPPLTATGSLS